MELWTFKKEMTPTGQQPGYYVFEVAINKLLWQGEEKSYIYLDYVAWFVHESRRGTEPDRN